MHHRVITIVSVYIFYTTAVQSQGTISPNDLQPKIIIQDREIDTGNPPEPLISNPDLGIVAVPWLKGKIIHRARNARRADGNSCDCNPHKLPTTCATSAGGQSSSNPCARNRSRRTCSSVNCFMGLP